MRAKPIITLRVVLALALIASAAAGACSLNPQPIPPGDSSDNAPVPGGGSVDASVTTDKRADGGANGSGVDAAFATDGGPGQEAGTPPNGDASDAATDAFDGGADADADADVVADAGADVSADAPVD